VEVECSLPKDGEKSSRVAWVFHFKTTLSVVCAEILREFFVEMWLCPHSFGGKRHDIFTIP
jgi:hypothetical protein